MVDKYRSTEDKSFHIWSHTEIKSFYLTARMVHSQQTGSGIWRISVVSPVWIRIRSLIMQTLFRVSTTHLHKQTNSPLGCTWVIVWSCILGCWWPKVTRVFSVKWTSGCMPTSEKLSPWPQMALIGIPKRCHTLNGNGECSQTQRWWSLLCQVSDIHVK